MRLADKVAIVTGGGRGNGRGIALGMAREGAAVVVADIIFDNAKKVAQEIKDAGGQALAVQVDVTDPQSVEEMVQAAVQTFGKVTTLVNNAGVIARIPFMEMTLAEWQRVIDIDLTSNFIVTQTVAREMAKVGGGAVIMLSSTGATQGLPDCVGYCAAKGGVKAMNGALAGALAPYGIRVNAIAPGPIPTDMNPHLRDDQERQVTTAGNIPLGRIGSPDDLAGVCSFLVSDDAAWITGAHVAVDGGMMASRAYKPGPRQVQ